MYTFDNSQSPTCMDLTVSRKPCELEQNGQCFLHPTLVILDKKNLKQNYSFKKLTLVVSWAAIKMHFFMHTFDNSLLVATKVARGVNNGLALVYDRNQIIPKWVGILLYIGNYWTTIYFCIGLFLSVPTRCIMF